MKMTLHSVAQQAHPLIKSDHAREVHEDYLQDTRNGMVTVQRYMGFLQGVAAAGGMDIDDYYDVSECLSALRLP